MWTVCKWDVKSMSPGIGFKWLSSPMSLKFSWSRLTLFEIIADLVIPHNLQNFSNVGMNFSWSCLILSLCFVLAQLNWFSGPSKLVSLSEAGGSYWRCCFRFCKNLSIIFVCLVLSIWILCLFHWKKNKNKRYFLVNLTFQICSVLRKGFHSSGKGNGCFPSLHL